MRLFLVTFRDDFTIVAVRVVAAESAERAEELAKADFNGGYDEGEVVAIETPVAEGVIVAA